MLVLLGIETKVYIYEFRWFVRFGLIYAIVEEAVMFNFIISVQQLYSRSVLYLYINEAICQVLFGVLLLVYVPTLDPYPGYTPIGTEIDADAAYEELPEGELIRPERRASLLSRILFSWMKPIMKLGYERPITAEKRKKMKTTYMGERC